MMNLAQTSGYQRFIRSRDEGSSPSRCLGQFTSFAFAILALILISSDKSGAQWRKIGTFDQGIFCIYPLDSGKSDSYTAFVGGSLEFLYDGIPGFNHPSAWRTTDGGRNWNRVFEATAIDGAVTSFTFKDSITGWLGLTGFAGSGSPSEGCFATKNGGTTWTETLPRNGNRETWSVYYNPMTRILHCSRNGDYALYSLDEGSTWMTYGNRPGEYYSWSGYAFLDSLHGIVPAGGTGTGKFANLRSSYSTTDGGHSWQPLTFNYWSWQPIVFHGSYFMIAVAGIWEPLDSTNLFRSNDNGQSWTVVHSFQPTTMSPFIQCDSGCLYAQTAYYTGGRGLYNDRRGVFKSSDEGSTWSSICGPENVDHSTFYASNYGIWAGSEGSIVGVGSTCFDLWYNRTKKANADRMSLNRESSNRVLTSIRDELGIAVYYPSTAYYEGVDSVSFVMNCTAPLYYIRDSAARGWTVTRRETSDSSLRFILLRTDPAAPATDSLLLRVFFRSYLTKDRSATIALDEINFNQDTTYRECMIASLTKNDSLFVEIQDECGDSILREFIRHDGFLRIESIRPNPTTTVVTLDVHAATDAVAEMEVTNVFGASIYRSARNVVGGTNAIRVDTHDYVPGLYFLRLSCGGTVVSSSFVKQ
jgi:photosystem II stability/assembly factor-like uncharacterized protein